MAQQNAKSAQKPQLKRTINFYPHSHQFSRAIKGPAKCFSAPGVFHRPRLESGFFLVGSARPPSARPPEGNKWRERNKSAPGRADLCDKLSVINYRFFPEKFLKH